MTIRQQIIARVTSIEDPVILNEILAVITAESDLDVPHAFTAQERSAVNAGLKDLNEGRFFTHEQAVQMVSRWLNEQSAGR